MLGQRSNRVRSSGKGVRQKAETTRPYPKLPVLPTTSLKGLRGRVGQCELGRDYLHMLDLPQIIMGKIILGS